MRAGDLTPGTVMGIQTSGGDVAGLISHSLDQRGVVLRIFVGGIPDNLGSLASTGIRFTCVSMPEFLTRDRRFTKVGTMEVPAPLQQLPIFRFPMSDARELTGWRFWDGSRNVGFGKYLSPEELKRPFGLILFPDALIEMIETSWTPETDEPTLKLQSKLSHPG